MAIWPMIRLSRLQARIGTALAYGLPMGNSSSWRLQEKRRPRLSASLRAEIPADHAYSAIAGVIEPILQAISTDPAAATDTVVTVYGEFRVGEKSTA